MKAVYTRIAKNNLAQIANRQMTPEEMIGFLKEGALYRKFPDVLRQVCQDENPASRLARNLEKITGLNYADTSRKVRNWMTGKSLPQSREDLFQICFALHLDEASADCLLMSADETGIHYRNPDELVYAFALRTGRNYQEAQILKEKMREIYDARNAAASPEPGDSSLKYTRQIRDVFSRVRTEEELEQFFLTYSRDLGVIHRTAHEKFTRFLDDLQNPQDDIAESLEKDRQNEKYSVERIVKEYIRMHVPSTRKTKDFSYIQKVIKKNWPSESELIRMKKKKKDVSRKAMIILFLVTEDFELIDEALSEEDEGKFHLYYEDLPENADEKLEIRLKKINLFLGQYGMNWLDPGNPFDCLVLYALRAQYGDEVVSEKFSAALKVLFEDQNKAGPAV